MHVGIAYLRWRGKRSRHSRRMRTRNFAYLARGPWSQIIACLPHGSSDNAYGYTNRIGNHSSVKCCLTTYPSLDPDNSQPLDKTQLQTETCCCRLVWIAAFRLHTETCFRYNRIIKTKELIRIAKCGEHIEYTFTPHTSNTSVITILTRYTKMLIHFHVG